MLKFHFDELEQFLSNSSSEKFLFAVQVRTRQNNRVFRVRVRSSTFKILFYLLWDINVVQLGSFQDQLYSFTDNEQNKASSRVLHLLLFLMILGNF